MSYLEPSSKKSYGFLWGFLVFFVLSGLGLWFFIFPKCQKSVSVEKTTESPEQVVFEKEGEISPVEKEREVLGRSELAGKRSPKALLEEAVELLKKNAFKEALSLLGVKQRTEHHLAALHYLFLNPSGPQLKIEGPLLEEVGSWGRNDYWLLSLKANSGEKASLLFEMQKQKEAGWRAVWIQYPKKKALALPEEIKKQLEKKAQDQQDTKVLLIATEFLKALLSQDFPKALSFVNAKKLHSEKIATLCILFEEGGFSLPENKALKITLLREKKAWLLVQIRSQKTKETASFGLEMQRSQKETKWKISGINFSELIAQYAKKHQLGEVAYTPLVQHPEGGESLALYFEFDHDKIHSRAKRQLEIVASLLQNSPEKELVISGHADALGTEGYNQSLSAKRAHNVKKTLISLGVSTNQIITKALGESRPLKPNRLSDGSDNPQGRKANRRAEIYLNF